MKIKVIVWQEENTWCASVPALPGCHTWGESYEQLMIMVKEAIEGWLEVASEQESLTDNQQLVEISLWNQFLVKSYVKFFRKTDGYWQELKVVIIFLLSQMFPQLLQCQSMAIEISPLERWKKFWKTQYWQKTTSKKTGDLFWCLDDPPTRMAIA